MPQLRNLIAFFWVAVVVLIGFAWWYDAFSFKGFVVLLVFWLIAGFASAILEFALMPNLPGVPKRFRIAGQIFRGACAAIAVLLAFVTLISMWRDLSG